MKPLILVSGYARSGTSLMCRMLEAAGLEVIVGPQRKDEDNPNGYYESKRVSQMGKDPEADREFVKANGGKVLKVLSHMLFKLPDGLPYRTIYMLRDPLEVACSLEKMNARRMRRPSRLVSPTAPVQVARAQKSGRGWLQRHSPQHLVLWYGDLIKHPLASAMAVSTILQLPDDVAEAMAACVDPELYRNRACAAVDDR